jgi:hypothetical protein
MAYGRRQHAAVDQLHGKLDWHGSGNSV